MPKQTLIMAVCLRIFWIQRIKSVIKADSTYSGEHYKNLLSAAGFENRIHEKVSRNHPLSTAATVRKSVKSQIRVMGRSDQR